ncbi:helix-turn-helix transcriptional regulator [Paenibacillus camelliae]|uniref:helix-turn-helix transcriptional regulator n=1 Tax=Paenibacillus camelliae TaxID=512410 RepID=UPI00203F1ED6|nr:helix-turn-helix transcriptional regulator [Paenibacillus camelliae]MCM3634635.1 AraC family transcriptional regulator [Paenibacillus camelliae]
MEPIRKPFYVDPIFPLEVVYKGLRDTGNELPDHLHDLYEIVYIHEGSGTFFIDHSLYEKKPGDLYLIPGNTIHRSFPSADEPIVSTAIFFAPSLVQTFVLGNEYDPFKGFDIARKTRNYKLTLPKSVQLRIEATIEHMGHELQEKNEGYRQALWLQLQQILLELFRHPMMKTDTLAAAGLVPQWMQSALHDINLDPVQCGGLAELSEKACVSAGHFSRVFKQLTGMNVTDYVNAKRIAKAKELLLSSDDTIETIAQGCGFQGMRHFYETFKKLTGETPKSYRRKDK